MRWSFFISGEPSPFDCDSCSAHDMEQRNCSNRLGLSEEARAVEKYTAGVKAELGSKGAKKVLSIGGMRLYECPLSYIGADTADIMRIAYLAEGTGHLLYPGGWAGQPMWLAEAYEIYRAERARESKDRADER